MRSRAETAWVPRPELEEARSALAAADLVTLVGPPGIGKSRLARELLSDAPTDETLFVDAASCVDLAALRASLARALDLLTHDESEDAPRAAERLGRALCARGRPTVWLDDFEHLAEEAAETIARWRARDAARFLITSRRPLRLRGERVISLAPLPTERADGDGAPSPASRLFLARAATARPGWSPDDADLARVEAIVARLEGIPLAIELAAARMHAMGTAEIARGLAHPLELSAAGPNDAARHATLRAAIVTSWELLRPWEQAALAQLSVFRAGFTLAAAEAVLALDEGAPWPMDVVQRLVEHSLVMRERRGDLPEARFRLYDGVRAFATEQLAERDPDGETRRRHAEALLARAEANVDALATEDGPQAARRLDAEREDLEHFAREGETAEARGRFALVLAARAELGGGGRPREALEAAAADLPESSPTRVRLTISLGHALLASGALREATHRLSGAWERARELGEREAEARALAVLASALWRLGEVEASELHARDALSIARAEGHRRATSRALRALASARMHVGALREALELLEEARAVDRALGDEWALGETLDRLGAVRKFLHQDQRALEAWNEALAAHRRTGNLRWEAVTRSYLAELHVEAGEDAEAARELERAALAHARAGDAILTTALAVQRALVDLIARRPAEAHAGLSAGLDAALAGEHRQHGHLAIGYRGVAALALGRWSEAEVDLARARDFFGGVGNALLGDLFGVWLQALEARRSGAPVAVPEDAAEEVRAVARMLAPVDQLAGHAEAGAVERLAEIERDAEVRVGPIDVRAAGSVVRELVAGVRAELGHTLLVDAEGAWFRWRGEEVELGRKRTLRRVLVALVEERRRRPGEVVPAAELVAAGWPGEQILEDAARIRLRVALSSLRKLGLSEALLTGEGGYLLDPSVPLRVQ